MSLNKQNLISLDKAREIQRTIDAVNNMTTKKNKRPRRRVRTSSSGGGSGTRAYVIITSVTDAENYTGDVIAGPEDGTVINTGVTIKSINATSNPFEVGYSVYADTDGTTYYIDGYLLG